MLREQVISQWTGLKEKVNHKLVELAKEKGWWDKWINYKGILNFGLLAKGAGNTWSYSIVIDAKQEIKFAEEIQDELGNVLNSASYERFAPHLGDKLSKARGMIKDIYEFYLDE